MVNLDRFAQTETAIVPIVNGWGQINGRKLYFVESKRPKEDGWYSVTLGQKVEIKGKTSPLEIAKTLRNKKVYQVYPLGEDAIPVNFDNFARLGFDQTVHVYFMNARPFNIAEVVLGEDKRFYYFRPAMRADRTVIRQVQEAFEKEQAIGQIKGITPELRYYFLVLSLQKQSVEQLNALEAFKLSQEEKEKRIKQFEETFAGRLAATIERAGGTLVKYFPYQNGFMVHWHLEGDTQIIKSIIRDDMRMISLGYCASGHDREHSLASAIQLAKLYTEEYFLNITRN